MENLNNFSTRQRLINVLTGFTDQDITTLLGKISLENLQSVASAISANQIKTIEDLSTMLDLSITETNALLSDDRFNKLLVSKQIIHKKSQFALEALNRLSDISLNGEDETSIKAIKVSADVLGFTKKDAPTVNINLESVINRGKEKGIIIDIPYPGLE